MIKIKAKIIVECLDIYVLDYDGYRAEYIIPGLFFKFMIDDLVYTFEESYYKPY